MSIKANSQQAMISDFWLDLSKHIFTTQDKYNLTTFVEGHAKHLAEVAFINRMDLIKADTTILDLACGNGRLCEAFCDAAAWVTGTDLCEDFIAYLNQWRATTNRKNVDFFKFDLLTSDYLATFERQYSLIFLFGVSQCIIQDEDLLRVLNNVRKILQPNGKILLKQTTSIMAEHVFINNFSEELQQHWIAKYRTEAEMRALSCAAGLEVISAEPIYQEADLGVHYQAVERWDNTRQILFQMVLA
jgi:SAM-dependent methyltransferase